MKFNILKLSWILVLLSIFIPPKLAATQVADDLSTVNSDVPVLCYHRVLPKALSLYDITPAMLEKHFQLFIKNGFHPITALQYITYQKQPELFPIKPIVLTFDDGNKSHYQYVLPLLKKFGFKATFFIYPSVIARKSTKLITWDELSEMAHDGMDIESHTMTHPFLTDIKSTLASPPYLKWLDHEFKDSKTTIEKNLNIKVSLLAYPFGWYNNIIEKEAVEAGYTGIFTVNWGTNSFSENPLRIKRKVISSSLDLAGLDKYINSRPLAIEIISPTDSLMITEIPAIQFKLLNQELKKVNMIVGKYKGILTPDSQGIFTFAKPGIFKPGYYMIIISGYDDRMQYYLSSWGFDYRKPLVTSLLAK